MGCKRYWEIGRHGSERGLNRCECIVRFEFLDDIEVMTIAV